MAEAQAQKLNMLRIDRSAHPRRKLLRRWPWWVALAVVLALAVGALVVGRAPSVRVAEVREARPGEEQTELTAAGYVSSRRRSVIAPQVAGRLVEVAVDEGDAVKKGQVLARLDDRDARVAAARAQAELQAANQRLIAAQATATRARSDLARAERLAKAEVVTRASLEESQATARATAAEEQAASAQLASARRAAEEAELQRAHTVVRAPFSGTVVKKLADEGAVLAPAALEQENIGGIVELVDLGALEVEAEVSEEQLPRIEVGQPALVFLDAYPDQAFRARVRSVRPTIDRSKATAVVNVQFDEIPPGVLPDMGSRVAFLKEEVPPEALAKKDEALRVPAAAVVQNGGQSVVWVVQDGRLKRQPVQVARKVGDEVALAQGPSPGTQVVVSPEGNLRPGRKVKVRKEGG
ncbi:efflux RND transporter periplasmic adaptor subunit [Vitiosangium sp. GDMCC 1.1324]|uniref:efflux RND transporter periplasmic adaptor subunit n=1 Tax=Vitiosangium sp. (strain GDMCC 1.1324) TaxID=2138576 RepID=UPI000D37D69E|nr:efflux RND transporter periplasmic adaptor subunit [Vitiosangium sp. GDMCC 1.1324]PTL83036.1 efflux RND transporter periplasmic adaptor subunit [Vitiosangium sp. GDMCC 1.1324]